MLFIPVQHITIRTHNARFSHSAIHGLGTCILLLETATEISNGRTDFSSLEKMSGQFKHSLGYGIRWFLQLTLYNLYCLYPPPLPGKHVRIEILQGTFCVRVVLSRSRDQVLEDHTHSTMFDLTYCIDHECNFNHR